MGIWDEDGIEDADTNEIANHVYKFTYNNENLNGSLIAIHANLERDRSWSIRSNQRKRVQIPASLPSEDNAVRLGKQVARTF